jgi:ABC-type phosphate transport system substrate-binding protein
MRFSTSAAALAAATLLGLAQPAAANGFFTRPVSVQAPVSGSESQAQLASDQLSGQGSDDQTALTAKTHHGKSSS